MARYLIGMDFGTASVRGVLIDIASGVQLDSAVSDYRNGLIDKRLSDGSRLPHGSALHMPSDYLVCCQNVLSRLGGNRKIVGIGIAATASSPLPTSANGSLLVEKYPANSNALIKLWKHGLAQHHAEQINKKLSVTRPGASVSGEGLLAKALELQIEAPDIWQDAERYIEVGDWLVWQLTGRECRSLDFACYKALYSYDNGYPSDEVVPGLSSRVIAPTSVGQVAGYLTEAWLARTGILGDPIVSVASIDSHAVLPAVSAEFDGTFVGVLGTSSGFLRGGGVPGNVPAGYEAGAYGAALPNSWCCEAGQAAFGDMLGWFVQTFPSAGNAEIDFQWYNDQAAMLDAAEGQMLALDWFGGNRVPFADNALSGLLMGLKITTTPVEIYQALVECLSFGIKSIIERAEVDGYSVEQPILTGTVALENPFIVQTICDVLGRMVNVADIRFASASGAAIHAAVASGVISDFAEGYQRFGCKSFKKFAPNPPRSKIYRDVYPNYLALASDPILLHVMRTLSAGFGRT
ncbi:FGGY-family carbohydrate kinase [Pararhizobium sp. PWRC1-1]|uniref:FGGY-family carbohydrate kinase n=1 Tax=Pararhizobium sp. PWRC1-1 TaxID=2804566 RepID=UPI003CF0B55A